MTTDSKKNMIVPFLIIAGMFFVFGFVTWINGALIPFMKSMCELSSAASFLVVSASYISFVVMAVPSAIILQKVGYKKGMAIGLFLMAIGALIFIPAASSRTYVLFLIGIFVQGAGMTLLQTASNPYIVILGPIESGAKRISIMGICNKVAGMLGSIVFGALLLSGIKETDAKVQATTSIEEKNLLLDTLAESVVMPYLIMAIVLVVLGVFVSRAPLPDLELDEEETLDNDGNEKTSIFQFPHLILGVIALFFYVGVEVVAGDTIIAYGISKGLEVADAKFFTSYTLGAMVITYLLGALLIPKVLSQKTALLLSGILGILVTFGILFTDGITSVIFVAILGFANALVWPAIWPLALTGLGKFTKTASALLIMAIAGGAVISPIYGFLADGKKADLIEAGMDAAAATSESATFGYWALLPCYAFILYYAVSGHKIGLKES
jgi:FHS family L-fucose permease-like MFS transporter